MIETRISLINGLMFGIENISLPLDDFIWGICIDLFFIRISISKWNHED